MSEDRLHAVQDALRKVQEQAAALEELSEQLSLSVHVLETEIAALGRRPPDAPEPVPASQAPARSSDVDGARLVALHMALAGEPREQIERYLAEHFDVPDRGRLLDEVCAAAAR